MTVRDQLVLESICMTNAIPIPLQISCPLEYGDAYGVIVPLQDAVIIIAVQYSH